MKRIIRAFQKRQDAVADRKQALDPRVQADLDREMAPLRAEFDSAFYRKTYPDIRALGGDPLRHYCLHGWHEGRDPNATFSTQYYLRSNPDVAGLNINPFLHYVQEGRREGRKTQLKSDGSVAEHAARKDVVRAAFDPTYYLQRYKDVAQSGIDPLEHYYTSGWKEGRDPALGFSTSYYLATNPDIAAAGVNPFWHYIAEGQAQGRAPIAPRAALSDSVHFATSAIRADFDVAFYLERYPDVAALCYDPVEHYCVAGWLEGRDPSPDFSTLFYLAAHQDVVRAEINPFLHFVTEGRAEGRAIAPASFKPADEAEMPVAEAEFSEIALPLGSVDDIRPHFDVSYYRQCNSDLADSEIDPVAHYWSYGWKEGRDPTPGFSTQFYLESNPDVAAKAEVMNPFWHFVMAGQHEGRMPVHPGGHRVERLRHTEPLEQNVARWMHKVPPPALMSAQEVTEAIANSCAAGNGALTLSVGHDHYIKVSGGVQLCIHQEQRLSVARGVTYLNLYPWQPLPRMAHEDQDADPIMGLILNGVDLGKVLISDLVLAVGALRPKVAETRVVIHHLLGHLPERIVDLVQATGQTECWLWLHDFFTVCPNYALQRNGVVFCDAPPVTSNACTLCRFGKERLNHLPRISALFDSLKVHVMAPSEVTLELWQRYTDLQPESNVVLPHMSLEWIKRPEALAVDQSRPVTIGYIGFPAPHKGWDVYQSLVRQFGGKPGYRFVYFGANKVSQANLIEVYVHVTADSPNAMIDAVRDESCDFILHWATCAETFSFSTFEALAGGAYVLTNPISGNVAATVTSLKRGAVLPDETALIAFFEGNKAGKMVTKLRQERAEMLVRHTLSPMVTGLWYRADEKETV